MSQSQQMTTAQKKTIIVDRLLKIKQSNSSSSPDLNLIKRLQQRTLKTNHPMFKLSIKNYEMMCEDDKKLRKMAEVFNTNTSKLKKICKKLHIFKKYIDSSPETIKNKMKAYNMSIIDLPKDLRNKISTVFSSLLPIKYEVRNWILNNKNFINEGGPLSENLNAIDFLIDNPNHKIYWPFLSKNPNAIKLLEEKNKEENKLTEIELENLPTKDKINWQYISENPNAKKLLETKFEKEQLLDNNEIQEDRRRKKYKYIDWRKLSENPCAIDLLRRNINRIDWNYLSVNPNPKAIELLNLPENHNGVVWRGMPSTNTDPVNLLNFDQDQNEIDWYKLSKLANNEEHMKLLQKRAAFEDTLSDEEYRRITYLKKIHWPYLLKNPAIFIK